MKSCLYGGFQVLPGYETMNMTYRLLCHQNASGELLLGGIPFALPSWVFKSERQCHSTVEQTQRLDGFMSRAAYNLIPSLRRHRDMWTNQR